MNKWIISGTIVIISLLIVITTTYKVIKIHNSKILLVESKYIIEASKRCVNEKKCNEDIITLKTLYELNYLEKQVNEVTKEYYNENSYVKITNGNYEFIIV